MSVAIASPWMVKHPRKGVVKSREPFKFWQAQPYPWNGWSSQALST